MKFLSFFLIVIFLNQIPAYSAISTNPVNIITVHGKNEIHTFEVQRQVAFYAEELGIQGVSILVSFSHQMPAGVQGFTKYEETAHTKTILIKINRRLRVSAQELTLAHEMVHARQFVNKELVHHKDGHYSWKGEEFKNIRNIHYKDRAWEEEAFKLEKQLLRRYREFNPPVLN